MVRAGDSNIRVTDNRAGNRSNHTDTASVIRTPENQLYYSITNQESRKLLARDLVQIANLIFNKLPADRIRIHLQRELLLEALNLLAKDSVDPLLVRQETVQYYLNEFFELMREIDSYSIDDRGTFLEMGLARNLKKFIKHLNNATNRSILMTEFFRLNEIDAQLQNMDPNEFHENLHFHIDLDSETVQSFRYEIWEVLNRYDASSATAPKDEDELFEEVQAQRTSFLAALSPDVLAAYVETERILYEVAPLAATPEDEYFMEQIEDDYYPHIFDALTQFKGSVIDFQHKETVVLESIKQFKIIQLGLQKIIDRTVANRLTSIKSQTDFLKNKVLGNDSLTLSSKEADDEIDATLEEAKRIREELYKQHVAPVLEKNKAEHDAAVVQNREEYEAELVNKQATYDSMTVSQKASFDAKVAFYRAENVQQKVDFDSQLVQQKADFDAQLASNKREIISGYKKELALRTDGFKKTLIALKNQHKDEIAALEEDNERISGKYQAVLQVMDKKETSEYHNLLIEDELGRQYEETLSKYEAQIVELKSEAEQLRTIAAENYEKTSVSPEAKKQPSIWYKGESYNSSGEQLEGSNLAQEELRGEWQSLNTKILSTEKIEVGTTLADNLKKPKQQIASSREAIEKLAQADREAQAYHESQAYHEARLLREVYEQYGNSMNFEEADDEDDDDFSFSDGLSSKEKMDQEETERQKRSVASRSYRNAKHHNRHQQIRDYTEGI